MSTRRTDAAPPPKQRTNIDEQGHHAGKWNQVKGQARTKWGDLTDDDLDVREGNAEYLAGKLQERYGWQRDRAEQEVRDFERTLN